MTSLDHAVNNDLLIVAKALVPYLDIQRQKPIAILIKAIELLYTINLYSNPDAVLEMSQTQEPGWEKEFLKDVKDNLNNDKAYFIDAILKLLEVKDLVSNSELGLLQLFSPSAPVEQPTVPTVEPTPTIEPAPPAELPIEQIVNSLSSLLDSNNLQLINGLSTLFKSATLR